MNLKRHFFDDKFSSKGIKLFFPFWILNRVEWIFKCGNTLEHSKHGNTRIAYIGNVITFCCFFIVSSTSEELQINCINHTRNIFNKTHHKNYIHRRTNSLSKNSKCSDCLDQALLLMLMLVSTWIMQTNKISQFIRISLKNKRLMIHPV